MANVLSAELAITGSGQLAKETTGILSSVASSVTIGSGNFDALSRIFEDGTSDGKANEMYSKIHTIAAGANADLDLAGGLTNDLGETITFTSLRAVVIAIDSPLSTKSVRVGPQNVANGAQLWFGGVTAVCYEEVVDVVCRWRSTGGWTVTAGTGDILRIHNPSAVSVDVQVWLIGTK